MTFKYYGETTSMSLILDMIPGLISLFLIWQRKLADNDSCCSRNVQRGLRCADVKHAVCHYPFGEDQIYYNVQSWKS